MTISTRSWAHCWSHYQGWESLYLRLGFAKLCPGLQIMMMMLMVPHANCNSKLEVEVEVAVRRGEEVRKVGRVFICEINKNYSLSRAASEYTCWPRGNTWAHSCSVVSNGTHKEFPSLLCWLRSHATTKLDKHGARFSSPASSACFSSFFCGPLFTEVYEKFK